MGMKEELKDFHATITDIQRFSLHDGPGIRTVVFFKGCPLRCQWCQNPETQNDKPQVMFFENSCIGCGACIATCKMNAVSWNGRYPVTDLNKCISCGACAEACMSNARTLCGERYTVDEVISAVMRDETFYKNSGGGVTLSGGEVTVFADFASELLKRLKEIGIHSAIETCGFCSWENMVKISRWTDLFLYDIKHIDDEIHRTFTGRGVSLIHQNLLRLRAEGKEVIIRVPLIPGVNDDESTIRGIGQLAKKASVSKIHLLPFHQAGENKWKASGKQYFFAERQAMELQEAEKAKDILLEMGILASVGGGE